MDLLISIYPKYCQLIKKMEKNYEFRPFHIESNELIFWVYETKPTKQLKYKMVVDSPIVEFNESFPYLLGKDRFEKLVASGRRAYRIIQLYELEEPISLVQMKKQYGVNAPQNFIYLENYRTLLNNLNKKPAKRIF